MWVEDDFEKSSEPCLESCTEPTDGKSYIMYHGTSREAAKKIKASGFNRSSDGMLGRGVYVSRDLQKASRYPLDVPERRRVVLKLRVEVGKVKKIDKQGHPMQKTWHDHGYDTAWCPPKCGMVRSGLEEDCIWDPQRIKVISTIYPKTGSSDGASGSSDTSEYSGSSDTPGYSGGIYTPGGTFEIETPAFGPRRVQLGVGGDPVGYMTETGIPGIWRLPNGEMFAWNPPRSYF